MLVLPQSVCFSF